MNYIYKMSLILG